MGDILYNNNNGLVIRDISSDKVYFNSDASAYTVVPETYYYYKMNGNDVDSSFNDWTPNSNNMGVDVDDFELGAFGEAWKSVVGLVSLSNYTTSPVFNFFPGLTSQEKIDVSEGMTISIWIKQDFQSSNEQGLFYYGNSIDLAPITDIDGFGMLIIDSDLYITRYRKYSHQKYKVYSGLTMNEWHNIVYTFPVIIDGTSSGYNVPDNVYVDGELVWNGVTDNPNLPYSLSNPVLPNYTFGIQIGSLTERQDNTQFSGLIDEFIMEWKNVWTDEFVKNYYDESVKLMNI
jgi:hypothetical protein